MANYSNISNCIGESGVESLNNASLPDLDRVIDTTIRAVEEGQREIFSIYEHTKAECDRLWDELEKAQRLVRETILRVEQLEKLERSSRHRLLIVSRDMEKYQEEDIKEAYDDSRDLQIKLFLERERELHLTERRNDLERNYRTMEKILSQSENVSVQMGVAISFLRGNMDDVSLHLTDAKQKHYLAGRIIANLEEERSRMAREIHDGAAQTMANVLIHAEICERLIEAEPLEAFEEIKTLKKLVRNSLADLRTTIFNLRPPALDDLGLEAVLRSFCVHFQESTGIFTDFKVLGDSRRLDANIEVTLFRIVQEALSNVRKHARAKNVIIRYETTQNMVSMHISDDGQGFSQNKDVGNLNEKGHFGLLNIRERVELLNGKIFVESAPGQGTKLKISFPLDNT